jgi:hypothetical protein
MAEEGRAMVSRAPGRGSNLAQAQRLGLFCQAVAEVQVPRSGPFSGNPTALHYFRPYFIAWAANAYPTVHYYITGQRARGGDQTLEPSAQDLTGRAPPPRMKQGDALAGSHEVDRNTVGDGHGQEDPGSGGDPAIDPLDVDPALSGVEAHDLYTMNLVAEHDGVEGGHLPAKRQPAVHHAANRFLAPQTEVEPTARLFTSGSNARDYAVAFSPAWDLVKRKSR